MEVVYIMHQGEYSRQRIVFVTLDVKEASKVYTEKVKDTERTMCASAPYIQIWRKNELIADFLEWEENEKRLIKHLSKLSRGLK